LKGRVSETAEFSLKREKTDRVDLFLQKIPERLRRVSDSLSRGRESLYNSTNSLSREDRWEGDLPLPKRGKLFAKKKERLSSIVG